MSYPCSSFGAACSDFEPDPQPPYFGDWCRLCGHKEECHPRGHAVVDVAEGS